MQDSKTPTALDSIYGLIAEHAKRAPEACALQAVRRDPLSYGRLLDRIEGLGQTLRERGIARSDTVAVVLPNGPEMAAAFLSIAAWCVCAPLNPAYREDEIEFYLTDLGAKAIVLPADVDGPARQVAKKKGLAIVDLEPSAHVAGCFGVHGSAEQVASPADHSRGDDVALVLHTSGTTSRPKQVPLSHHNLCASARNIAHTLRLTTQDRCLNIMPMFHIHGLVGVLLSSMTAGGSVVCSAGYDADRFEGLLREFQPTWYSAVPTIHQSILERAGANSPFDHGGRLRLIRSSSAALPPTVMAGLEQIVGVPVIEAYGMTEASHQMASNPLPPARRKPGSVGLAAGPEVAIMDEGGNLLPAGQTGEIVIRGANVTAGYANNPEANKTAFTNGWFRTGDLGSLDAEGYISISGRKKEMINRGGEKISPREIDEVLLECPAVAQAVAFAVPHRSLGEDVVAAVVLRAGRNATEAELREFAFSRLAEFKVPSQILFLTAIPKGPTGKVQRIGLHEKLAGQMRTEYEPPQTATEQELSGLWKELLNLPRVGRADNFFMCGGDSLLAARLATRVRAAFGVEMILAALFRQPALSAQASLLDQLLLASLQADNQLAAAMLQDLDSISDKEAESLLARERLDQGAEPQ